MQVFLIFILSLFRLRSNGTAKGNCDCKLLLGVHLGCACRIAMIAIRHTDFQIFIYSWPYKCPSENWTHNFSPIKHDQSMPLSWTPAKASWDSRLHGWTGLKNYTTGGGHPLQEYNQTSADRILRRHNDYILGAQRYMEWINLPNLFDIRLDMTKLASKQPTLYSFNLQAHFHYSIISS